MRAQHPETPDLPPVIEVAQLHDLLEMSGSGGSATPVRLLDVRWALDGSKGEETYRAGHIPGAVYIDLPTELAAHAAPGEGRHPLPAPEHFAATMDRVGVRDDTPVIAYDDTDGSQASRLVWMLRALGHPAALLNGGLAAWDGELSTTDEQPATGEQPTTVEQTAIGEQTAADVPAAAGSFTPRPWPATAVADVDEVAAGAHLVIDARAPERYRGDVEPIDPRAGHVPGAVNVPFAGNVDATGRFLPPEQLRARFAAVGAEEDSEIIVYCGSGVTANHDLLALQRAGFCNARLFPGSWSQWSADDSRAVATGERP